VIAHASGGRVDFLLPEWLGGVFAPAGPYKAPFFQDLQQVVDVRLQAMSLGEFRLGFADGLAAGQAVEDFERRRRQGEIDARGRQTDDDLLSIALPGKSLDIHQVRFFVAHNDNLP
jgi:hypothetical protein